MKFKLSFAAALLALGCALPAAADTLTLVSTGGTSVNGVYIYPYNFNANIGGNTSTVSLMCVDFNREINFGETWTVQETGVPLDSSTLSTDLRALALIYFGVSTNYLGISAADYQFAAWDIFDDSGLASNSGLTPLAKTIASVALDIAAGNQATPTGFSYSNYAFFVPTEDMTGWTAGIPQRFVGGATPGFTPNGSTPMTPTPEPSSLMLLGTGILGVAGHMYRRMSRAAV